MSQRVAVIGASNDRRKFGNKALRAFAGRGYEVYPVNPHETEVEGHRAWPDVGSLPVPPDIVTFYVPPEIGLGLIDGVAAVRPAEVWFNPGSESPELVARARAAGLDPILACSIMGIGESPSGW